MFLFFHMILCYKFFSATFVFGDDNSQRGSHNRRQKGGNKIQRRGIISWWALPLLNKDLPRYYSLLCVDSLGIYGSRHYLFLVSPHVMWFVRWLSYLIFNYTFHFKHLLSNYLLIRWLLNHAHFSSSFIHLNHYSYRNTLKYAQLSNTIISF